MERDQALELLNKYVSTPHIKTHSLAVEAVMRALAERLEPCEAKRWALAGLLHDLDNDVCGWQEDMSRHGPKTVELLKEHGFGDEGMYRAILAHNPANGSTITNSFERALYAGDPITGFITAIALVYPDKKLSSVKAKSIVKRMKETRFAAGANREAMWSIEELGIDFPDFAELALNAMVEIADDLGL